MMKDTFKWSLMLTGLVLSGAVALAQPGPPPPGNNPPPPNARPRPNNQRMTPEERRKESEVKLRQMMTNNGITDTSTQDAVLAYLSNELETRKPLRQMGVKLQRALTDQSITDDQIKAMIADYKNAQDLESQNRTKAQSDLDAKIHYSKNPRLQGMLMLMGVLGDGPPLMEGSRRPNERGGKNRPNQDGNKDFTNPEQRKKMLAMFDKNGDGKLDAQEKAAMEAYIQQQRGNTQNNNQAQPPPPPPNNTQDNQTDHN
ncbi:MAG: hypothetical protein ABI210_03110 [Abditibacteriaceae bacterium]